MRRRTYLAGLVTSLGAGCVASEQWRYADAEPGGRSRSTSRCATGTRPDGEVTSESGATTAEPDAMAITGVFPKEVARTFFDFEYVELTNTADERIDVADFTLEYGDERAYTLPSIEVEPGAQVVVSSRSGTDVTLDRAPPIYHLFADFGQGSDTSVLDADGGRLVLRDADGTVIDTHSYGKATGRTSC